MTTLTPTGMNAAGQFCIAGPADAIKTSAVIGSGGTPSVALTAAAGLGATVSIVGSNKCGMITLNSGASAVATGKIMTLTLADGLVYPNKIIASYGSVDANFASVLGRIYTVTTGNTIDLYITATALNVLSTYTGFYQIEGY